MRKLLPVISFVIIALLVAAACAPPGGNPAGAQEPTPTPTPRAVPPAASAQETQGWLGIQVADITAGLAQRFELSRDQGPVVVQVMRDMPAEAAGFKAGDIILAIDGKGMATAGEVTAAIKGRLPGARVSVRVLRGTDEVTLEAVLGEAPKRVMPVTPPLIPELQGIPLNELFSHITGGQLTMTDKDGNQVTLKLHPGVVTALTETSVTVALNDESGEAVFTMTDQTHVMHPGARDGVKLLRVGDEVMVVTVGDSRTASLVQVVTKPDVMPFLKQGPAMPDFKLPFEPGQRPLGPDFPFTMPDLSRAFMEGAIHGKVTEVGEGVMTVETADGPKAVVVSSETVIMGRDGKLGADTIKAGQSVVVMTEPAEDGKLQAKMVFILPDEATLEKAMPGLREFMEQGGWRDFMALPPLMPTPEGRN